MWARGRAKGDREGSGVAREFLLHLEMLQGRRWDLRRCCERTTLEDELPLCPAASTLQLQIALSDSLE